MPIREKLCCIVGAGVCDNPPVIEDGAFVIAADGGLATLRRFGMRPDLILGDFDSLGHVPMEEGVIRLPVEKDETDMAASVREGLSRGYRRFHLYGGTGGREDHTLANIALLYSLAKRSCQARLIGNGFVRTVIVNDSLHIKPKNMGTVSVFSLTEESLGVTLRGLKYTLEGARLAADTPLGVSNSFVGEEALVSVENGALLVMWEE